MLLLLACATNEPNRPKGNGGTVDTEAPAEVVDSEEEEQRTPDLANGEYIHDDTCMSIGCHDQNDKLVRRVPELTDTQIFRVVRNGEGYMQPQDHLSDEDILDCIAYLRTVYP